VATPTTEETSVCLGEPRSRSELVLEMIALRHQIAVLKRSRTRRPCFGLWDRLFWILLSWRWPRWPESLMIIQPETVKRWRRHGWSEAVEISVRWSLARRTSQGFSRSPRTDQSNGSGELPLGCTANPRRAAHAWVQDFPGDRIPLLGDRAPKSRAIVADVYSQSGARLQIPGRS